jgi:hypothetical protein
MTGTRSRLARRYRRLLLCYPRAYRRDRGDEIVGTLLDLAPANRQRPTFREASNLVRHGLRTRLGRPASRTVVAWSLIAAVACGLFASSAASWGAWWTARPLHNAEGVAVFRELFPDLDPGSDPSPEPPSVFVIYGQPLSWDNADDLLLGDGGEYGFAAVGSSLDSDSVPADQRSPGPLLDRLRAGGWSFSDPIISSANECIDTTLCDPATLPTEITVYAGRGDQELSVVFYPSAGSGETAVSFALTRSEPPAVVPAGLTGGLAGFVVGWLLFGWASRRTERHGLPKVLFGVQMFLWWAPIFLAAPQLLIHHLEEWHYTWHPLWEWLGQPTLALFFLAGCLCGLGALLVALPRRVPGTSPDVAIG